MHARTLGHVIDDCVAAPDDLASLKRDLTHLISEVETRLRAEISKVEILLRAEMQELEARLNSKLEIMEGRLNRRIDELWTELRFHRWVSGITLAFVVATFAQSLRA